MPSKSKAQAKLFQAAAGNPAVAKKRGIAPGVAKEYAAADRKKGFANLPQRKGKRGY